LSSASFSLSPVRRGVGRGQGRAGRHIEQRQFAGRRIGYPRIGAGLAGGDWQRIAAIIDEELAGEDHTLVEFDGGGCGDAKQ